MVQPQLEIQEILKYLHPEGASLLQLLVRLNIRAVLERENLFLDLPEQRAILHGLRDLRSDDFYFLLQRLPTLSSRGRGLHEFFVVEEERRQNRILGVPRVQCTRRARNHLDHPSEVP